MPNNRIFYAVQAVKMRPCQTNVGGTYNYGPEVVLRGVQSVGLNTSFNLEQVYQLGQLDLYSNIEEVPDIEITMTKVLDGTRTLYNTAIDGSGFASGVAGSGSNGLGLTQISDRRCDFALGIWDDTSVNTSGSARTFVVSSGAYVSSVTYNLVNDGNFTEDLTLVSNNLKWNSSSSPGITSFSNAISGSETKKIARRWTLNMTGSTLPTGTGGGMNSQGGATLPDLHLNTITISCNLGREAINQLGMRAPYYRYINFPVEVTSEFEVTAVSGSNINADDFSNLTGCSASASGNLSDKQIVVSVCDPNSSSVAYTFDLGTKNKLTSANQTGGDTGGGNVTVTYSYQTFNYFNVSSPTGAF